MANEIDNPLLYIHIEYEEPKKKKARLYDSFRIAFSSLAVIGLSITIIILSIINVCTL